MQPQAAMELMGLHSFSREALYNMESWGKLA